MLDEQIKHFGESGQTIYASELVGVYNYVKGFLMKGLIESPIESKDYRENNYLQLKALDSVMNTLINRWK